MKTKILVDSEPHIQAMIDQERYNELQKIIYRHHSQFITDFTLFETQTKDVITKTLECYETSLKNAIDEIKRLCLLVEEKDAVISSLVMSNIHVSIINGGGLK